MLAACSTAPAPDDGGATDGDANSSVDARSMDGAADGAASPDASADDVRLELDAAGEDAASAPDASAEDGSTGLDASDSGVATDASASDSGIAPDASRPDAIADSAPDVVCPAMQTLCAGRCVDTQSDLMNCGACATVCPAPPSGTAACLAGRCGVMPGSQTTQPAGSAAPIELGQPALALTMVVATGGNYPTRSSSPGTALGMVHVFATNFAPNGAAPASGQVIGIATNSALFSLLGTTYGGDGRLSFALPNMREHFLVATGSAPGLPPAALGVVFGNSSATLSAATMPAHAHLLADGVTRTSSAGRGEALDIRARSLPLTAWVATEGVFPSPGGGGGMPFLGQIRWFAGGFTPDTGWVPADGRLLSIAENSALFAVVGTTYGGDGVLNFAVPDLRGRVPVGAGSAPGRATVALGELVGASSRTLTTANLPTHQHNLAGGGATRTEGASQAFSAYQPSLGITWLIATQGIFPSRDGSGSFDDSAPTMSELIAFAGNFAPRGFALAEGQLLSISTNTALFALLGTQFGGDGRVNFALPDLRGRGPIAAHTMLPTGATRGVPTHTLVTANLPAHTHAY